MGPPQERDFGRSLCGPFFKLQLHPPQFVDEGAVGPPTIMDFNVTLEDMTFNNSAELMEFN